MRRPTALIHASAHIGPRRGAARRRAYAGAVPLEKPQAFGAAEFQLVLLRRMADYQPDLVDDARRRLGASMTQMREANAQWQRMSRGRYSRGALAQVRGALGAPRAVGERRLGDLLCRAEQWVLPLWPDLRFEALAGPDGALFNQGFVRSPDAARPELRVLADLGAWSCVVGDLEAAFGAVRYLEGSAPSRMGALVSVDDGTGTAARVLATFVWGLLQRAEPADTANAGRGPAAP
jgi:hypothetical protein